MDIAKLLVEPPASLFLLALAGLVLALRFRRLGFGLVAVAAAALYALSTPIAGHALLRSLEAEVAAETVPAGAPPGAIVILSAGIQAADFAGSRITVDALTVDRLRRGAALHRETGLPVLLSGGLPRLGTQTLADMMAQSLRDDFRLAPQWLETRSTTTAENAIYSAEILSAAGIGRIYLVTQAWHLPRAQRAFNRQGIEVVPGAVAYEIADGRRLVARFIPAANALARSRFALHEYIGRVWLAFGGTG